MNPIQLGIPTLCLAALLSAQEAKTGETHRHGEAEHSHGDPVVPPGAPQPAVRPNLILPRIVGPRPWTDKPVLRDPSRFHIAILSDRTGGHRPGVWMQAVRAVNLLRPDFVMSVGDLIEGYSEDDAKLEAQWKEFTGFVDQIDMRFFFVPGNHDVTNSKMHRLWREKFGREYYSFDYKGVHFLSLLSEDPVATLGAEQLAWIKTDLERSAEARWTLIFMHKPLWSYAARAAARKEADKSNWSEVEAWLGTRPHTCFAGHHHSYVQFDHKGRKHYQLATTGGSSRLRGVAWGEFDHLMWLTMEAEGPRVANLLLDGILPGDVLTEAAGKRFRKFVADSRIKVEPILIEGQGTLMSGTLRITLQNRFDQAVELRGRILGLPLRGLHLDPQALVLRAAPGQTRKLELGFRLAEPVAVEHFRSTLLEANLRSLGDRPLHAELTVPVVIDEIRACPQRRITVDGNLSEWGALPIQTDANPRLLGAAKQWTGPADCSGAFAIAHDGKFLYLAGRVRDEEVRGDRDRVRLHLDARAFGARQRDRRLRGGSFVFELRPNLSGPGQVTIRGRRPRRVGTVACRELKDGYAFEAAIPMAMLDKVQGGTCKGFQMALSLVDRDGDEDRSCSVLWRGSTAIGKQNSNFAHVRVDRD